MSVRLFDLPENHRVVIESACVPFNAGRKEGRGVFAQDDEGQGVLGNVATQEILLRSCPLSDYLRGKHRLKFWTRPDWTPDIRDHIREKIARRLALPWYKRLYDPIGIIGHAIGLTRLHIPALHYCSEFIADVLGRDNILVRQPSPADINRIFKNHPGIWKVFGRYDPDIFPGTDDGEQIINMKG